LVSCLRRSAVNVCEFRLRYVWYQTDSRRMIDETVATGCFVAFR
jgi:hypothetical protein